MANFVVIFILWNSLEAKRGDLGVSNEDFLRAVGPSEPIFVGRAEPRQTGQGRDRAESSCCFKSSVEAVLCLGPSVGVCRIGGVCQGVWIN